jgi:hypothetical protein
MLIISYELSYACPYNSVPYRSNRWFKHVSGAEAKFGSQKWWQCGNSSVMIIGRTEVLTYVGRGLKDSFMVHVSCCPYRILYILH